jgi:hypothetical protein
MKIIKYLLSVISMVLICGCSEDDVASFGGITGIVTNANSNEAISGAMVSLSPSNTSVQTDANGSFSFSNLDPGTYTVQVSSSNFKTSTTQVSVVAGMISKCDVSLNSSSQQASVELSSNTVTFDKGVNELTFTINNTGKSGSISWSISSVTVDWLTILPRTGTTAQGSSSTVKLTIDRSKISTESSTVSTSFIVEGTSFSKAVTVVVNNVTTSGNQGSGTGTGTGSESGSGTGTGSETGSGSNTSSAKITSLSTDIKAEIISCKRNDDVVTLDFRLTNNGSKSYSAYFNQVDGKKTVIWTDDNQQYYEWTFNFNGTTSKYDINTTIPESAPCNGYVKISGVSSSAKILNVSIYVSGNFDSNNLKFLNVPIN